jgi:hypothetical protein
MLEKTRYILAYKGTEKIVIIKTDEDVAYWSKKAENPDYVFRELRVSAPPEDSCASCSA